MTHSTIDRPRVWLASLATVLVTVSLLCSCSPHNPEASASGTGSPDSWAYPIRLGDSRAKVHEFLGNVSRATHLLEEYPLSGVTFWFSPENRVAKVNLDGLAGALYTGNSRILSERALVFGLTPRSKEGDFARALGVPVREIRTPDSYHGTSVREVQRAWRKDGYLIDATFLASDSTDDGRTFQEGTLIWFEVSHGL